MCRSRSISSASSTWSCSAPMRRSRSPTSCRWSTGTTSTASASTAWCRTSWSRRGIPAGTGGAAPAPCIRDEINAGGYKAYVVGMALSGPDTGGSQWFITLSPQPHLDGGYTVFGDVERRHPDAAADHPGRSHPDDPPVSGRLVARVPALGLARSAGRRSPRSSPAQREQGPVPPARLAGPQGAAGRCLLLSRPRPGSRRWRWRTRRRPTMC